MKREEILRRVNLPRYILNHTVGEDHPIKHRLILGFGIMIAGHCIGEMHIHAVHYDEMFGIVNGLIGCTGGFIHAFGAVPWLDFLISLEK